MKLKGEIGWFSEEDWVLWPEAESFHEFGLTTWTSTTWGPIRLQLDNGLVLAAANGMKAWFDFGEVVESEECYVRSKPIASRGEAFQLLDFMFRIQEEITADHLTRCGFELE